MVSIIDGIVARRLNGPCSKNPHLWDDWGDLFDPVWIDHVDAVAVWYEGWLQQDAGRDDSRMARLCRLPP
jgi:hypothetical protein